MTDTDRTSKQMSPTRAGLVLRLQEWSRNCLIDGLKMDKGEPTLQALLREAATVLMRSSDETTDYRAKAEARANKIHELRAALGRILSMAVTIGCDAGHAGIEAECRKALEIAPEEPTAPPPDWYCPNCDCDLCGAVKASVTQTTNTTGNS
jgi:hypothetical protein